MQTSRSRSMALALMLIVGLATTASAQPTTARKPRTPPAQQPPAPDATPATPTAPAQPATPASPSTTGGQPVAPSVREAPAPGPYLVQNQYRDLTLNVRLVLNSDNPRQKETYRDPFTGQVVEMPKVTPFEFQTLALVWPLPPATASADPDLTGVSGKLTLNDRLVDDTPEVLRGYPGGTQLARFDTGDKAQETTCRQVELRFTLPMRCFNTVFDEKKALTVPWPNEWPAEAVSVMQPQLYVETGVNAEGKIRAYDDLIVREALAGWLNEAGLSSPKAVGPVALAKTLTSKVWANIQPSGDGLSFMRTGELTGVVLQPPAWTIEQKRGSEHDVVVTLAAVLRKAGLPTRVVIGWDAGKGDDKFLGNASKQNRLRSWVEFCLYDEKENTVNWIPVDIIRMRKMTTNPPPLTREWRYFGTHNELDSVTPISLHFHPPTDVVSYGWPAFWGWFVTPKTPEAAEQALNFSATLTPKRPGDDPKKKGDKDDKSKPVRRN